MPVGTYRTAHTYAPSGRDIGDHDSTENTREEHADGQQQLVKRRDLATAMHGRDLIQQNGRGRGHNAARHADEEAHVRPSLRSRYHCQTIDVPDEEPAHKDGFLARGQCARHGAGYKQQIVNQ